MKNNKLKIVLCWHMHQPWYRESLKGDYQLPWVYLHALKDYSDMAAHFEAHPGMRAVVNFTPVLLEQLDDYADQLRKWQKRKHRFAEPLLNQLAGIDPIPTAPDERVALVEACLRAHAPRMIDPYPGFVTLLDMACLPHTRTPDPVKMSYLNNEFFLDLLTWYHIAWLGFSVKCEPLPRALIKQGTQFTEAQRHALLDLMGDLFSRLIDRYRVLAERGQIELSVTPYAHPIMPLLIDFESMACALPGHEGPSYPAYPQGRERARWHLKHGIDVFQSYFGMAPKGTWLSEGSISDEAVAMLPKYGLQWTASGEGVWHNSCSLADIDHSNPEARHGLFGPHELPGISTRLFFRDDGLSDLIGFEYQNWRAEDAASDFVHHLHNIATYLGDKAGEHAVSVILDGENAWEYFPDNAFHFLGALYERLVNSNQVEVTTFSDALDCCPARPLPSLCAGSWVYGSFSTWIGETEKNLGWDRLVEAKQVYDKVMASGRLTRTAARKAGLQLAICEGSDWFWWFGDYNPEDSVRDFDSLYRRQLCNLYELLGEPIPANLSQPISTGGGGAENAGTMRRGHDG